MRQVVVLAAVVATAGCPGPSPRDRCDTEVAPILERAAVLPRWAGAIARSALLPPGHPALGGAPGFNERFGMPDRHGGTSQLSADGADDVRAAPAASALTFLSTP